MRTAPLPRVDEHTTVIAAGVDHVWPALLETLDRTFSRPVVSAYARIVGCTEATAAGPRPLAEGAKIPGFRVAGAAPARELLLEGRHRFSSYGLTFCLDPLGSGSSRLRAESRASFTGMAGRVYRLLVIGTGAHAFTMRRLLAEIRRRSEQPPARSVNMPSMVITQHNPADLYPPYVNNAHGVEVAPNARTLYISGLNGLERDGTTPPTFEEQAELVWRNLIAVLSSAGMSTTDLVSLRFYLAEAAFDAANVAILRAHLGEHRAARTVVCAQLLEPSWLIELEAIAAKQAE
jgi:enamine deaminase RidA (YjgF/YER057c/UK114 family)